MLEHWTAQTKEEHDVELAERHLARTERDHNDGWATDDELEDARQEVARARVARAYRAKMRSTREVERRAAREAWRVARGMGVVV